LFDPLYVGFYCHTRVKEYKQFSAVNTHMQLYCMFIFVADFML